MIVLILVLLGLCMGSFVEATTWRLRQQENPKKRSKKYSITKGHSMCAHCKHRLSAKDLIPLFSWLWLRGKCRYCHKPIGWQAPLLELSTAGLFVISYLFWPYTFGLAGKLAFATWLAALVLLIALAVYDLRWMLLPDRLIVPLTFVAITLVGLLAIVLKQPTYVWQPFFGGALLGGLFWLLFQLSDGRWIGGGDVKIAVSLGLIAGGVIETVWLLFIASLLGTIASLPLLLKGRKTTTKVPFGPFLITGTIVVFLWGAQLVDWYRSIIGV